MVYRNQEEAETEPVPVLPATTPPASPPRPTALEIEVEGEVVQLRRKKPPLEKCFSLEKEVAALLQGSVVGSKATSPTVDRNTWLSQKQQEIRVSGEGQRRLSEVSLFGFLSFCPTVSSTLPIWSPPGLHAVGETIRC